MAGAALRYPLIAPNVPKGPALLPPVLGTMERPGRSWVACPEFCTWWRSDDCENGLCDPDAAATALSPCVLPGGCPFPLSAPAKGLAGRGCRREDPRAAAVALPHPHPWPGARRSRRRGVAVHRGQANLPSPGPRPQRAQGNRSNVPPGRAGGREAPGVRAWARGGGERSAERAERPRGGCAALSFKLWGVSALASAKV